MLRQKTLALRPHGALQGQQPQFRSKDNCSNVPVGEKKNHVGVVYPKKEDRRLAEKQTGVGVVHSVLSEFTTDLPRKQSQKAFESGHEISHECRKYPGDINVDNTHASYGSRQPRSPRLSLRLDSSF